MRLCLTENVFILPSLLFKSYWIYNFTLQFFFSKVVRPLFHCFLFLVLQLRRTIKCSFQGPWVLVSLEADDLLFSLSDNVNSNDVPWYGSFCTHSLNACTVVFNMEALVFHYGKLSSILSLPLTGTLINPMLTSCTNFSFSLSIFNIVLISGWYLLLYLPNLSVHFCGHVLHFRDFFSK